MDLQDELFDESFADDCFLIIQQTIEAMAPHERSESFAWVCHAIDLAMQEVNDSPSPNGVALAMLIGVPKVANMILQLPCEHGIHERKACGLCGQSFEYQTYAKGE